MIELKNAFNKIFLTIKTDPSNTFVEATWNGYATEENIKTGVTAYTQALVDAGVNRLLIDTRFMIGTWEHSLKWLLQEWAPRAAQMGLNYYALVVAPETFAEDTAHNLQENLFSFRSKVFENLEDAKDWLTKQA